MYDYNEYEILEQMKEIQSFFITEILIGDIDSAIIINEQKDRFVLIFKIKMKNKNKFHPFFKIVFTENYRSSYPIKYKLVLFKFCAAFNSKYSPLTFDLSTFASLINKVRIIDKQVKKMHH